jgi:hypothetical protein
MGGLASFRSESEADGMTRSPFVFDSVIEGICRMAWDDLDNDEIMRVAKAYYYFSVQFRENLEIAMARHPGDPKLAELGKGECDTDNLSPCPGVADPGERMDHDEFMRRLLGFHDAGRDPRLTEAGVAYLAKTRSIDDAARAASIGSYEDGGLTRVFTAMLRAPHWFGKGQRAFRFFLEEHIRFDSDDGAGHGSLSRHLAADDRILPLWTAFRDLLVIAVPKLAMVSAVTRRTSRAPVLLQPVRLV